MAEPVAFPTARSRLLDPPDGLAELRRERPICPLRYTNGEVGHLVTSHALAHRVLTDSRLGRGDRSGLFGKGVAGDPARTAEFERACEAYGDWRPLQGFIFLDPPEHTRIRRLLAPHFTMRRMAAFRPRIDAIVGERLDALEAAGPPADLLAGFAAPVALLSQCALLGIPPDDVDRFFRLSTSGTDAAITASESVAAWREAWEYVRALVARKRHEPADGVIGELARRDDLSDDELADTAFSLFQGGLEATGDMLALAVFVLLCHEEQLALLRAEPTLVEGAVEELLRYVSINHVAVGATAFADVELDGTLVRAGETVAVSLAAANRDPAKFPRPDVLDLRRSTSGHVAFSQGIHMCIGQHLARLELQLGLARLLERFPGLRLAVPADEVPVHGLDYGFWRLRELPVAW